MLQYLRVINDVCSEVVMHIIIVFVAQQCSVMNAWLNIVKNMTRTAVGCGQVLQKRGSITHEVILSCYIVFDLAKLYACYRISEQIAMSAIIFHLIRFD